MAAPPTPRWSHRPGLDGLRGLAVVAVVAYHLGYLGGGFLGVDVFLVLSGYLITGLALGEIGATGHLSLRAFWGRRVRRLVPALLIVVTVVTAIALAIGWPKDQLHALGWDGVATLTWWANWRQVQGPSYWASGENLFRHAWSLSIEEQFYLVWPLVLVAVAAVARRWKRSIVPLVGAVAVAGAVASAGWQLLLSHRSAVEDLSRVYVGTDTRAVAPLVGCALACLLAGNRSALARSRPATILGALGAVTTVWFLFTAEVASPALYRNGVLVIVSLAAAAMVAWASGVSAEDRSPAARAVAAPVTRYLGLRSYAIYLWSWPIQVLLRFQWPDLSRAVIAAITVTASLALAEISYRLVEDPIRRGTGWARHRSRRRPAWGLGVLGAGATVVIALVVAVPPPAHERIGTEEAAAAALRPAEPAASTTTIAGKAAPLRVLVTGDSVAWTIGKYQPDPPPPGIGSIESRAIIGCGLLSVDSWGYPQGGTDDVFTVPGSGACRRGPEAERLGLAAHPDVVLLFPGAWEWSNARSPDGKVIDQRSPEMEAVLQANLDHRIATANDAGARFVIFAYACPGAESAGVRSDPVFIRWFNALLHRVVDEAVAAGAEAQVVDPTDEVCVDGDPAGRPTPAKVAATGDELHVADVAGGRWMWDTWIGPALVAG